MSVNLENSTTTSTTVDQAMEEAVRIANASAAQSSVRLLATSSTSG